MKNRVLRALDALELALRTTVAVILGAVALLVCWQVFARYVLHASPYWVEEFSVTALMWIGLLGSAACVWTGSHMSLELLVRRLPAAARVWVQIAQDVIVGLFAVFLCTQGWVLAEATMTSRMSTIPLPIGVSYLALPVAGVVMALFAFASAVKRAVAYYHKKGACGA
jgi:TRAP-type C4-dicarboxylate transport system permease small subunit